MAEKNKKNQFKFELSIITVIISLLALVVSIYSYRITKVNIIKSIKPILYVDDVNLIFDESNRKIIKGIKVRVNNIGLGPAFKVSVKIDDKYLREITQEDISLKDNSPLAFLPNITNSGKSIGNRSYEASQYLPLYFSGEYQLQQDIKQEELLYKNKEFEVTCMTLKKHDTCKFTNIPNDPKTIQNLGLAL